MRTAQSGFSEPSQSREIKRARELAELALRRATKHPETPPALVKVQPTEPPGPVGTAWLDTSVQD